MLDKLPVELVENIFSYCFVEEKLNVACCNRKYSQIVTPSLWKVVVIPTHHLTPLQPDCNIFTNIKHATSLKIVETITSLSIPDNFNYFNYGFNMLRLLNHMHPAKVASLEVEGMGDGLCHVLQTLSCITCLILKNVQLREDINWERLFTGSGLKDLYVSESNVTDEFVKSVMENNKLRSLSILDCNRVTNHSLLAIAKTSSIKHLNLKASSYQRYVYDIGCLRELYNLKHLELAWISTQEGSLRRLWSGLNDLETLRLVHMPVPNKAFDEIHFLLNLTKLDMYGCTNLTSHCFLSNAKTLGSLRHLTFDAEICLNSSRSDLFADLSSINEMCSLDEITIEFENGDDESDNAERSSRVIQGLCRGNEKKWILTSNMDNVIGNYCLHRVQS